MKQKTLIVAALASAAAVVPAHAADFVFNYTADADYSDPLGPISATIHLTTSDVLNALGGYDILSASGMIDGAAILGLKPNPTQPDFSGDGIFLYNNVVFLAGAPLDSYGFVVNTVGHEFNFGYDGNEAGGYIAISVDGSTHVNGLGETVPNYRITVGNGSLAAVPEPASWATMLAGFGLAGTAMRRRRATVRFA